jgi:uncharacterized protein YuzE
MAKIQDLEITHLQFEEEAAPATPAAGLVRIYAKTDGLLYMLDAAGVETVLGGAGTITKGIAFYIDGDLAVETTVMSFIAPAGMTVQSVKLAVDTAPTDAAIIIDIHKNGTTLFTTQGNRPTIAASGSSSATSSAPDVTEIAAGDKITLEIDQVGSTVAGANLAATVICEVA